MFNFKTFILLISVITISVFTLTANTQADGAKIVFAEQKYDFGKVTTDLTLEHKFIFTNEGSSKLIIQSVHPSCGCTGATIGDKKEFDKGETGEIKVTFNTQGRSGVIEKTVMVTSNDPNSPQVTLSFTCEIN